jgi:hypothetical protein
VLRRPDIHLLFLAEVMNVGSTRLLPILYYCPFQTRSGTGGRNSRLSESGQERSLHLMLKFAMLKFALTSAALAVYAVLYFGLVIMLIS